MRLGKDIHLQMSDDLKKTWLTKGLQNNLQIAVMFAEEVDMPQHEERLKRKYFSLFEVAPPEVLMKVTKNRTFPPKAQGAQGAVLRKGSRKAKEAFCTDITCFQCKKPKHCVANCKLPPEGNAATNPQAMMMPLKATKPATAPVQVKAKVFPQLEDK